MKQIKSASKYLVAAVFTFLVATSCSKDDDTSASINRDDLIGEWILEREEGDPVNYYFYINVRSNGDWLEASGDDGPDEVFEGRWSLSGNRVTINYDDGDVSTADVISVSASRMTVISEDLLFEFAKL